MVAEGVGGGFGTVGDSKLGEDGFHVRLGSVFRDAKLLCDVVIGQSACGAHPVHLGHDCSTNALCDFSCFCQGLVVMSTV